VVETLVPPTVAAIKRAEAAAAARAEARAKGEPELKDEQAYETNEPAFWLELKESPSAAVR
jgi:hypothetical protein